MNAQEYAEYLASELWAEKRAECQRAHGFRCQVCGCTSWRRILDVHHLHYRNVGDERPEDLVPLCSEHHAIIHQQPDGYGMDVVLRLARECREKHWDDPLPAHLREWQLWSAVPLCQLCQTAKSNHGTGYQCYNCES